MRGAIYVSKSGNKKINGSQKVDATYVSIKHSCPDTCPLKDDGCYGQNTLVALTNFRMERRAKGQSLLDLARSEAKAIDNSYDSGPVPKGRALRLHVAGDSRTRTGTRIINNAIARWKKRGGGDCWSYTHTWKNVHRENWSNVSILASVTNVSEVKEARMQGYAPAIIVPEFNGDKVFKLDGSDIKWIPCVQQTRNIGCTDCRLCFNADRLYNDGFGIAFAAHGAKKNTIKRRLKVLI